MYHMSEDRMIETAMDAEDEKRMERKAENMSTMSFEDAVNDYREKAKGGLIFDEEYGDENPMSFGEVLAERISGDEKKLRHNIVRLEFFDEGDWLIVRDALMLPFEIHYQEFTYVGEGGNTTPDDVCDPEDAGKYDVDENWESCEETDIRDAVIEAISTYCLTAAAMAKLISAPREQRQFIRALCLIEANCHTGHGNETGGMTEAEAGRVCNLIHDATRTLWGEMRVHKRIETMERYNLVKTDENKPTTNEILEEDERKNAALTRLVSPAPFDPEQAQVLEEILNEDAPTPAETDNDAAGTDQGAAVAMPEPPLVPGPYAKDFASLDVATRTLTITHSGKESKFVVPSDYLPAWKIVRGMIESTDPEGWFVFEGKNKTLKSDKGGWRGHFRHTNKLNKDMVDLLRYIHGKHRGEGGPTRIRLSWLPRPKRKRKAKNTPPKES